MERKRTVARGNQSSGGKMTDLTRQVLSIGFTATTDATMMVIATTCREVPIASAALEAFLAVHHAMKKANNNRAALESLWDRCRYLTAFVVETSRGCPTGFNLKPLEDCLRDTAKDVTQLCKRAPMIKIMRATKDESNIEKMNTRLDRLVNDTGLSGTMEILARSFSAQPVEVTLPDGAPVRKSWYVERPQIVQDVYDRLCLEGSPRLIALVGEGGSGKTTVAAEIVMDLRVNSFFSDGITWLPVDDGAADRLPSLMERLAGMVDQNISERDRQNAVHPDSGTEHIKRYIQQGHQGQGLRCLVVADNVRDPEVVRELRKTGMWILITTRDRKVTTLSPNDLGETGEISIEVREMVDNAKLVLTRAAELPDDVQLPDTAWEVVELCGRMAMDLAFVGSWDLVHRRKDREAWQDVVNIITVKQELLRFNDDGIMASDHAKIRREAILRAGFNQFEARAQTLYLSLAVMPNGHAFTADHAAVLLYDRVCIAEDKAAVKELLEKLERWSVLEPRDGLYKMHDVHANIAREKLQRTEDVRASAVQRWTKFLSTLAALHYFDSFTLMGLCSAVSHVGGDGQLILRQYKKEGEDMEDSNPHLFQALGETGRLLYCSEYWSDASAVLSRLLRVLQKREGADCPFAVLLLGHLVECAKNVGEVNEAKQWRQEQRKALGLAMARVTKNSEIDVDHAKKLIFLGKAIAECEHDDTGDAEAFLRRGLWIQRQVLGRDNIRVAITMSNLGNYLTKIGRYAEAEEVFRKILEIKKAKLGDYDLQVAVTLHELGACIRNAGRYDEAEDVLRQALKITMVKLGYYDLEVAFTLQSLGVCLRNAERYDEAEEVLRQALEIMKAKLGEDDFQVTTTLHELDVCLQNERRYDEAEEMPRKTFKTRMVEMSRWLD